MKKLLFVTCISVILLSSCDWLFEGETGGKTFWAQDMTTSSFYWITADLLAENEYCKVYAEVNKGVTKSAAQNMADEYISIRSKMLNAFGFSIQGYDTLQIADAFCDEDGKLTILLLDIRDGYQQGVNDSYVAGYFTPYNFFDAENSNLCDMIYIDTNPGLKEDPENAYSTLVQELQHLMNFTSTLMYRREVEDGVITDIFMMDTWIDEGLSSAAEWVYSGKHLVDRWGWYYLNGNGDGLIDKGNNFFVWGNRTNENQYAVLDDYATVYLFFQWLRLQSGGTGIYKDIIKSDKDDYLAVTDAASSIEASYKNNWSGLLGDWLAANYIYNSSGRYGYEDDFKFYINEELVTIKGLHLLSTDKQTISLYPGEGVFSLIDTDYASGSVIPAGPGKNIRYYVLTNSPTTSMAEGALLTYNANNVNSAPPTGSFMETGNVTGVTANVSVVVPVNGRSVAAPFRITGPYRIGAGDVRRSGAPNLLPAGVFRLPNSIMLRE